MKCEICNKKDAETALQLVENGTERELYVCRACAQHEAARRAKKRERTRKTKAARKAPDAPPLLEAIVSAFSGVVDDLEQMAHIHQERESAAQYKTLPVKAKAPAYILRGRLHLEGLHLIGELEAVHRAMDALGMRLEGVRADGIPDAGHAYSLAYTGATDRAERVMADLVEQECNARIRLFEQFPRLFGDALCRALATLKNCRLLSAGEEFDLLSPLRLAACEDLLDGIARKEIERRMEKLDLDSKEDNESVEERDRIDAARADEANARFEDVVLNDRLPDDLP